MDEVDDELGGAFDAEEAGVDAQIVAVGVAPQLVGVKVVVLSAQLIDFVTALFGGLLCVAVAALDDALHTIINGRNTLMTGQCSRNT